MRLSALTITPYQRRHLQVIRDLIFHSNMVHIHLDWYESDQWLESDEAVVRLAWQSGRLVGILGLSKPLNQTSWIRMVGLLNYTEPQAVIKSLWNHITEDLRRELVQSVGILIINDWIIPYVTSLGFKYDETIITMERTNFELPQPHRDGPIVRVGELFDLGQIVAVDQAAFAPPWQMANEDIRQAFRLASSCTVAKQQDQVVGFQLSTLYFDGAHLARLAVHPSVQGTGVGHALMMDLLERFQRRGVYMLTVNTQSSNHASRNLYTRFGFAPTGFDLPYWSAHI
ncbi:MAG: GNAT family N-acetyltransferase [Anaerolineae bacterium]